MSRKKWVVTLKYEDDERLEDRVAAIVRYLDEHNSGLQWSISRLDPTGKLANELADRVEREKEVTISTTELLQVLEEDGQFIEFEVTLSKNDEPLFKIVIGDGALLDVFGTDDILPEAVLGNYELSDPDSLYW